MKIRRDVLLLAGLFLVLILVTVAASVFQTKTEQVPALSSNSNLPDGARALHLWLESIGYKVDNRAGSTYEVPPGTQAVLVLEPMLSYNFNSSEWKVLTEWAAEGGLVLVASRTIWLNLASSSLPVDFNTMTLREGEGLPAAPIFRAPPLAHPVRMAPRSSFAYNRERTLPLLMVSGKTVAVDILEGEGHIILISDSRFFTNEGLKEPGSAELVLNLLADLPAGSAIWFDEWHHGERADTKTAIGPEAWLTDTASGRALLYAAVIIFLWLVLAGRRFGRPVPLQHDLVRRAPLEYVTALASLNQRAGHRKALLQHYRASLKRAYGRRYRMDASLPDDEFVKLLARYKPDLDSDALLDLLRRLNNKNVTETQMVQLAREAADWMRTIEH